MKRVMGCRELPPPLRVIIEYLLFPTQPPRLECRVLITSPPRFPRKSPSRESSAPPLTLAQYYRLTSITATFPSSSEMRLGNGSLKKYVIKVKTVERIKRSSLLEMEGKGSSE